MLRLLLRIPSCVWIADSRSSPIHSILLHVSSSKTLNPSNPDLIESCGLFPTAALFASQEIHFKTTKNSDSFLALLTTHGFTRAQIASIITKVPVLLSFDPDKIKRKLEFFLGAGLPSPDLVKLISANPYILKSSLEKRLIPNFTLLKNLLGGVKQVATAAGRFYTLLCLNLENQALPNMRTLLEHGVDEPRVVMLAISYPRCLLQNPVKFSKIVSLVKEMGFHPSKVHFVLGIRVLSSVKPLAWDKRKQVYHSLGWSEEEIISAFKKHPSCMILSTDKIRRMFAFFVGKLKMEPSYLSERPILLCFSFEKRVFPRYMVLNVLGSNNLLKSKKNLASCLFLTEKQFIAEYLVKYGEQVPQLLEAYQSKLDDTCLEAFQRALNLQAASVNGSNQ